ncbi:MAG TPA: hypothetical protein VLZ10_09155 [Thermodesulfobacteriota bacterium]|nr:hypothetical protein [Thermodesulfobacteriota bacterium]
MLERRGPQEKFPKAVSPGGAQSLSDRWNTALRRVSAHPVMTGNASFRVGCS